MSKPRTITRCIRLSENTVDIWNILKVHKIKVADIFKQAGERAIRAKLEELKLNYGIETLPF